MDGHGWSWVTMFLRTSVAMGDHASQDVCGHEIKNRRSSSRRGVDARALGSGCKVALKVPRNPVCQLCPRRVENGRARVERACEVGGRRLEDFHKPASHTCRAACIGTKAQHDHTWRRDRQCHDKQLLVNMKKGVIVVTAAVAAALLQ